MKFTISIISAIVAASQLVAASPTKADASVASPQAQGFSITYCQHANYGPPCISDDFTNGACTTVDPTMQNAISSISVSPHVYCTAYTDTACSSSQQYNVQAPGVSDLYGTGYNDALDSYRCFLAQP